MSNKLTIGERIARIRKDCKISQQEIANRIGISRSLIGLIETNKTNPNYKFLSEFVKITNTTYDYLIDGVFSPTWNLQEKSKLYDEQTILEIIEKSCLLKEKAKNISPEYISNIKALNELHESLLMICEICIKQKDELLKLYREQQRE